MIDIFDALKRELKEKSLTKLNDIFYKKISEFIKKRENLISSLDEETEETLRLRNELENIKTSLEHLYDIREKKIVKLALLKAKEDSGIETIDELTTEEKMLFTLLYEIFKTFRKNVLEKVKEGEYPDFQEISSNLKKMLKTIRLYGETNMKIIRIIKEVPKFVGTDLKTYGPYNIEEVVILPKEIANLLIENGHAEEIQVRT